MKPIILGIISAFLFSFTYVLNRSMALEGGSWIWAASLRYIFLLPMLLPIVYWRKNLAAVFCEIKRKPLGWFWWSFIGFVVFYIPLTIAAKHAPAWLVAVNWEITLVAGICMTPFFYRTVKTKTGEKKVRQKFPWRSLFLSSFIILGVCVIQFENVEAIGLEDLTISFILITIGAIAYPLGNRKMMEVCGGRLDAFQRVLGMTIVTLPWWIVLAGYGFVSVGLPSISQTIQVLIVAFVVSLLATVLFFWATDLVKDDMTKLAGVEATQSVEIIFATIIEVLFLNGIFPSPVSWIGISMICIGMIIYSKLINQVSE